MARKNLLQGLMAEAAKSETAKPEPAADTPADTSRVDAARPRYSGGAIGAVSQSIAELKARSVIEIDPVRIAEGGLDDRLDDDAEDHDALVASIRDYGQQVPVLVRPDPADPERYQIVYGRRRVKAMRALGVPVKALVRSLDDQEMVVAQGQENSARKDLSFIEKASFARQMRDLNYKRDVICATLHVDKTVISRMLSVIDGLDPELVIAIGAAPSVGRDRWTALATQLEKTNTNLREAIALINLVTEAKSSDERYDGLMAALGAGNKPVKSKKARQKQYLKASDGALIGHAVRSERTVVLTLNTKVTRGFDEWLLTHLDDIHRDWKAGQDG